ncbi:DUF6891 domain-containing protein [Streptomyces indicus]|uniref:DUF6891 domain-containing protein n=1 Tax=Streptomyces indicus TaxID=417292 RepID=A0A1G8YPP1_9ACTN|nr:hypothetical protein [Streptomyces indicus]SDK04414.1 hypothetical protein SAMN05421806_104174 [Streptomyces indicus]
MLEIKVKTENWQEYVRIAPADLAALVARIGSRGDEFLVCQRIPDLPNVFIQTARTPGEGYVLEHHDGRTLFHTDLGDDEGDRVTAAIVGWGRGQDGWDAGFSWETVELPVPAQVPELPEDIREKVEERVRGLLVQGYLGRAALAEAAEEWLVDEDERPVSQAQARRLADRLWVERVHEQAAWQGTTDPERLAAAFTALDGSGITAKENFTCCRSCGMAEIWAAGAEDARGFVFFHQQGTEAAAEHGDLALYYGGFECTPEYTASVGREVVAALEAAGLSPRWTGSPDEAIHVQDLDWRRRLVG